MGSDLLSATRCPRCAAALRPGAPWCTLCHLDLRPPEPEPPPVVFDPLTAPLSELEAPEGPVPATGPEPAKGWPCGTCRATNPIDSDTCTSCGAGFLAALKAGEEPLLVLPGVGDLTQMGRGHRMLLAGAVVLAFVLLTLVVGLLLG